MSDSAERIARVIADMRKGNVTPSEFPHGPAHEVEPLLWEGWMNCFADPLTAVVDSTTIFNQWMDAPQEGSAVYDDHVLHPVWLMAMICFVNRFDNVNVVLVQDISVGGDPEKIAELSQGWDPEDHAIEWDRVTHIMAVSMWLGGYSRETNRHLPTTGPMHGWFIAVYEDGSPADIRWIHFLPGIDMTMWDNALMVALRTLNFMNCTNVELVEPARSRAQRRRIQRYLPDTQVSELRVRPVGQTHPARGSTHGDLSTLLPLHVVRGHFARYGPDFGRGLLFGKYAGRFWIQPHARGGEDAGVRQHNYLPEP